MADPVSADSIAEAANSPASASQDGLSATAVPIDQKIRADQYAKGTTAASGKQRGIAFSKLLPPGPVSDSGETITGTGDDT